MPMQVLELFAGIGGLSWCLPEGHRTTAVDIDSSAAQVYRAKFRNRFFVREIQSLPLRWLQGVEADFWWMSPPCQPFSRRGNQGDMADPRCAALRHLIDLLPDCQPQWLALENVSGFADSQARTCLVQVLSQLGYYHNALHLCPTMFGWPNRRPRFFLLAAKQPLPKLSPLPRYSVKLAEWIDSQPANSPLFVDESICAKFGSAMSRIDPAANAATACFGSSYGKSWLHSGSYLQQGVRLRRFSPDEVARQLGFPHRYVAKLRKQIPLTDRKLWKLLGNGLSLPVTRYVLSHFPVGASPVLPWHTEFLTS